MNELESLDSVRKLRSQKHQCEPKRQTSQKKKTPQNKSFVFFFFKSEGTIKPDTFNPSGNKAQEFAISSTVGKETLNIA